MRNIFYFQILVMLFYKMIHKKYLIFFYLKKTVNFFLMEMKQIKDFFVELLKIF